jgi:ribosomal protein L30E
MKIKVTITESRTEEIEVNFPIYLKNDTEYYALFSDSRIEVFLYNSINTGFISKRSENNVGKFIRYEEITEKEFMQAYEIASERIINTLKNKQ